MSSSAQHDLYDEMFEEHPAAAATATENSAALRRIAVERLAAHRSRRAPTEPHVVEALNAAPAISAAAQRVRDAVAARYQQAPSFREFMQTRPAAVVVSPAASWIEEPVYVAQPVAVASMAAEEPSARVETSARTHEAVSYEPVSYEPVSYLEQVAADVPAISVREEVWGWQVHAEPFDGELEVRPYVELPQQQPLPERSSVETAALPEELEGLEEEIEFRLAPEFVEHHIQPLPIQANIIEFPRQLVAAKKARPRLAEGPLRSDEPGVLDPVSREQLETSEASHLQAEPPQGFQMRIFEVEDPVMAQTAEPAIVKEAEVLAEAVVAPAVPEWQGLVLDTPKPTHATSREAQVEEVSEEVMLQDLPVAPFELRLMSSVVDSVCVGASFVVFVSVSLWMSGQAAEVALKELSLPLQGMYSAALLALLSVIYQAVFFSLGSGTLGMSYAGLEFLTLSGRKPSRGMVRRRLGANVLAVLPLGVGLLWSLIDGQKLGWNDRLSGLFLREF